jgi:transposase
MNATTTYAVDIAKNVFQLHWINPEGGEIGRKKLARSKLLDFFAQLQPARVVMEACGGSQHWARSLMALGHQVELLPAHQVRAFVSGNKDDAADARGIWLAAQHADIRRTAIKTEQQQAVLSVHRMRSHWVSMRTATINAMRSLLYEFGVVLPRGKQAGLQHLAEHRAQIDARLPAMMARLLNDQLSALHDIQRHVQAMEGELQAFQRADPNAQRLRRTPGIGLLGATALAATLGADASGWRNAREFAACTGLVPAHRGSGGHVRVGGISKRGDTYLRTLLVHGARALLQRPNAQPWMAQLLQRRPFNVAALAVAHKLARTAWALVAHQQDYDAQWRSQPPRMATAAAA